MLLGNGHKDKASLPNQIRLSDKKPEDDYLNIARGRSITNAKSGLSAETKRSFDYCVELELSIKKGQEPLKLQFKAPNVH